MFKFAEAHKNPFIDFLKWVVLNIASFVFLFYLYVSGYLSLIVVNDPSGISLSIFIFTIIVTLLYGKSIFHVSKDLNCLIQRKHGEYVVYIKKLNEFKNRRHNAWVDTIKMDIFNSTIILKFLSGVPVGLGLIGTVLGFIIMMNAIPASGATSATMAAVLISAMAKGLGTALYTTLVGAISSLWLMLNHDILVSMKYNYLSKIIELEAKGE